MSILNWFTRKKKASEPATLPARGKGASLSLAQGREKTKVAADAATTQRRAPSSGVVGDVSGATAGKASGHQFNQKDICDRCGISRIAAEGSRYQCKSSSQQPAQPRSAKESSKPNATLQDQAGLSKAELNRQFVSAFQSCGARGLDRVRQLVAAGADIQTQYHGQTALHRAVLERNLVLAELLISLGADINAKHSGEGGGTPLGWAVKYQQLAITKYLLEAGADMGIPDAKGETPLAYATRQKSKLEAHPTRPCIVALLQSHSARRLDPSTKLVSNGYGSEGGSGTIVNWDLDIKKLGGGVGAPALREVLSKLLECLRLDDEAVIHGYGFFIKDGNQCFCGNLRTTCAALCEDSRLAADGLVAKWNQVLNRPAGDWTTWKPREYPAGPIWKLFLQSHVGNGRRVLLSDKQLIISRVDEDLFAVAIERVNAPGAVRIPVPPSLAPVPSHVPTTSGESGRTGGESPNQVVMKKAIEELDAFVRKESPLHVAARNGDWGKVTNLLHLGRFGDQYSPTPDEVFGRDNDGRTALHLAAIQGHGIVVEMLLGFRSAVEAIDKFGQTSLHFAAANGHEGVAKQLIQHSADVDVKDQGGLTPLHLAARNGRDGMANLLLIEFADVNALDSGGNTPLDEAVRGGHDEIVDLLRQNGGLGSNPESALGPVRGGEQPDVEGVSVSSIRPESSKEVGTPTTPTNTPLSLSNSGEDRLPELIQALGDRTPGKRQEAEQALIELGERGVGALVAAIGDKNYSIQFHAMVALSRLSEPAVEPLILVLGQEEPKHYLVPMNAARVLGRIGDSRAIGPLFRAMGFGVNVDQDAAYALADLGELDLLVKALDDDDRRRAEVATLGLRRLGDPRAADFIAKRRPRTESGILLFSGCTLIDFADARAVDPLLQLYKTDDNYRDFVTGELARLPVPEAVEPLLHVLRQCLHSGSAHARSRCGIAAEALARWNDPRAVQPLIDLLDNGYLANRSVVRALGHLGGVEVIEPLMKVMAYDGESDQLRELRSAAAGVLAARGDQRGTQMLLNELGQDRYAFNAAVALLEARDPRGEEALVRIVEKDKAEKRFDDKPVILLAQLNNKRGVDELIEALPTILAKGGLYRDYSSQKIHALEILADSRDTRAFEVLRDATSAMLRDVPRAALLALGHLGDKRALETLIETLNDFNSPDCRAAASISLGRLGDKAAVDPLILALDDIDVDVQVSAATALGILGEARAAEPLIALLSRKPRRLRLAVIHALGQLGNSAAIEPLKSILNNNDPAVSARAADALRKLNEATKALQPAEKLLEASVEVPISQTDAAKPASTAPSPVAASSTTAKPFQRNPHICDICATSIEKSAGYAYTTRQVVTSIRYWRSYFEGGQEFGADVDGGGVGLTVSMLSGSATPWIVCEDCVQYVDADSKTARDYALANQEPPGCGAVDPQIACIPAGYGWSLVHNEWPVSIQVGKNPITHDSKVGTRCDFCRRIIYGDEKFGALDASAYKGQMDDGTVFVRKPPPSSQLLGRDTWIACFRCLGEKRRG